MPQATQQVQEPDKFDLKSLSGGWVALRKLTYGEILKRRDLGAHITPRQGRNVEVDIDNFSVTIFEFARAIVDHNLEDETGTKLNLTREQDIQRLDPDIATEIEELIQEMNPSVSSSPEDAEKSRRVGTTDS
jgi:hypothetical protein